MPHPFRFSAAMPRLTLPVSAWRAELRRIEDLGFWAVSDINADELQEFGEKFEAELRGGA